MSQKYHVNAMGDAKPCSATQGGCPFGGDNDHYATANDARKAYEEAMESHVESYLKKKEETEKYPQDIVPLENAKIDDSMASNLGYDIVVSQEAQVNGVQTTLYEAYELTPYGNEREVRYSTYLSKSDLVNNRPTSRHVLASREEQSYDEAYEIAEESADQSINDGITIGFDKTFSDKSRMQFSKEAKADVDLVDDFNNQLKSKSVTDALKAVSWNDDETFRGENISVHLNNLYRKMRAKGFSDDAKKFIEKSINNGEITDNHSAYSVNKIAYPSYKNSYDRPIFKKTQNLYLKANLEMANVRGVRETGEILRSLRMSPLKMNKVYDIVSDRSLDTLSAKELYSKIGVKSQGEYFNGEPEEFDAG